MAQLVEKQLVNGAVNLLALWARGHRVRFSAGLACNFAMAWREHGTYEWPADEPALTKILTVAFQEREHGKTIALVFKGDKIDENLTKDLNEKIFLTTRGRWLES